MKNLDYKSGFVSLIGRPNVGKSTLMNSLIGEKIAITSNKPQTTRNKIQSILTEKNSQIIFIDTPGIHKSKSKLGDYMVKTAQTTLNEVDIVLLLVEPDTSIGPGDRHIIESLSKVKTPIFLVINKIDSIANEQILTVIDKYRNLYNFKEIIPVSAIKSKNIEALISTIKSYLPQGPMFFPEDMITDQPEKQIASEIIREKILQLVKEEIPHGVAVEIMSMKKREGKDIVDIDANIYCEKDSHKGIIIGKQGAMLKEIGSRGRRDIQRLLGSQVYLQLWIKVKKGWRDNEFLLKNFGYDGKSLHS